jgi:hypothetical protein
MYTNCSVRLYVTRVDRGRVCRWAQEQASNASKARLLLRQPLACIDY